MQSLPRRQQKIWIEWWSIDYNSKKKRKKRRETYLKNKVKYNKNKRMIRLQKLENTSKSNTIDRIRAPTRSQILSTKRQNDADRQKAFRQRQKSANSDLGLVFKSRIAKSRALSKFKKNITSNPYETGFLIVFIFTIKKSNHKHYGRK